MMFIMNVISVDETRAFEAFWSSVGYSLSE